MSTVCQEYMDVGQKLIDLANSKGQVALTVRVSKWTVQRSLHHMDFGSPRPMRVPLFNVRHRATRLAWAREHRDRSVEDGKRVAWSDASRF
ncbi:HTH_Tnp_Tc3_2 domain-containing protein [Trichonephila clavipes]|nr:HTH_Tnp_Tc3_2 domain-containing protein [Trichonephila clavipes]